MSAKENITKLPKWCYGLNLVDLTVITIKAGELGYYPCGALRNRETEILEDIALLSTREDKSVLLNNFINVILNGPRGISKAQREAMEIGSQFGWDVPGANPDLYNEDGKFIK
jgi:hypothetical protein